MDFAFSPKTRELRRRRAAFMEAHVDPNEARFAAEVAEGDRWQPTRLVEGLKEKARAAGLWNLFLPASTRGAGLTNLEYAPLCEIMGRVPWAHFGLAKAYASARTLRLADGPDEVHRNQVARLELAKYDGEGGPADQPG